MFFFFPVFLGILDEGQVDRSENFGTFQRIDHGFDVFRCGLRLGLLGRLGSGDFLFFLFDRRFIYGGFRNGGFLGRFLRLFFLFVGFFLF